jgi:dihydroorotate dehydrogenase electron transfer subunit
MLEEWVTIAFNRKIAKDTFVMGFRSAELASLAKPGQFLMIHAGGQTKDPLLRRPFSIHGVLDGNMLTVLYKVVGRGTVLLSAVGEGVVISVIGPLGNGFTLPGPTDRVLLVAGGIGIAPLFFLTQVLRKARNQAIEIFLGFPSSEDVVLIDELQRLNADLSLITEDGSLGLKGLVSDLWDETLSQKSYEKAVTYACGPASMLKKIAQKAIARNLRCYVSLECHMACGLGICLGCAVKAANTEDKQYYYACQDGPVFSAEMIDWEAL